MARPTKQGIDFFPIDCQFDDKTEMYIMEKGSVGLAVLITTWQFIYHNEGYYILNTKDLHLLIKRRIDTDINDVDSCINTCLGRNIFDKFLHLKHGILTSKAIQERYFLASRKKKIVQIYKDYVINGVKAPDNAVYVVRNATKEKGEVKEKGKEEKKKDKKKYLDFVFLSDKEYEKLVKKFGKDGTEDRIENMNEGIGSKGYKYDSHYFTILAWERKNERDNRQRTGSDSQTQSGARSSRKDGNANKGRTGHDAKKDYRKGAEKYV